MFTWSANKCSGSYSSLFSLRPELRDPRLLFGNKNLLRAHHEPKALKEERILFLVECLSTYKRDVPILAFCGDLRGSALRSYPSLKLVLLLWSSGRIYAVQFSERKEMFYRRRLQARFKYDLRFSSWAKTIKGISWEHTRWFIGCGQYLPHLFICSRLTFSGKGSREKLVMPSNSAKTTVRDPFGWLVPACMRRDPPYANRGGLVPRPLAYGGIQVLT